MIALLALLASPVHANPDVLVVPRRPGQSNVRYFDFDWQKVDLFEGDGGGVRLYYYERERVVAGRAAAIVEDVWHELGDEFGAYPERRFPFVLYSSYQEFLRTNLFPLGEGVLGVTSPRDLTLTLPWFGDERLFRDVAKHELAHQFTIQEVQTASRDLDLFGDPLGAMPLWFIEGLAEYYAQGGLDDEALMVAMDMTTSPEPRDDISVAAFWEDRPWDVSWTYKMGQVRCAFLEEAYGAGTIQDILEESPRLVTGRRRRGGFEQMVGEVVGRDPDQVAADFETWVKRGSYSRWLEAEQHEVIPLEGIQRAEAMDASPDGELLVLRMLDFERGVTRLQLVDPRNPRKRKTLAVDNRPGTESLHPVSDRTFDITDDRVVWIAERRGHDVLYVRSFEHRAEEEVVDEPPPPLPSLAEQPLGERYPEPLPAPPEAREEWKVRWDLGPEKRFDLVEHGLVAAFSPALGPDGRVAFVGLTLEGIRDVYVLDPETGGVQRLTDDPYSERQVVWGPDRIVFTSSATGSGFYNLFSIEPDGGTPRRISSEDRDQSSPTFSDDRLFYTAWENGRSNLYELVDGEGIRRTDVATGLFEPSAGRDGKMWALSYEAGRRRPAEVELIEGGAVADAVATEPMPPETPAEVSLADAEPYRGLSAKNWQMDGLFGFVGGGGGGVYGQLLFISSDVLRTRLLTVEVAMYGRPEYTDGYALLVDQSGRTTWGVGPFQFLRYRIDEAEGVSFLSGERFFGGLGTMRWPIDRFMYVQADLSLGGATGFLFPETELFLTDPEYNGIGDLYSPWEKQNVGVKPQAEAAMRFGIDTVGFHVRTGPLTGNALLVETRLGTRPTDDDFWYGSSRLDAAYFLPLIDAANLSFRLTTGTSYGERPQNWWLSSLHTLRGVRLGSDRLVGDHFGVGTAELQVPLDAFVRIAFISNVEAVAAVDAGSIAKEAGDLWDQRVLDGVVGANIMFGPLVFRLHFARPIDIGAPLPTGPTARWVPNVSLDYLYR